MRILLLVVVAFVSWGCGVGKHMPVSALPKTQAQGGASGLSYKRDILPIFRANCASCHNASSPASQPNWLDYATAFARKDVIYNRVFVTKDMPPNGGLTDQQRASIAQWIKDGAPEDTPLVVSNSPNGETARPNEVNANGISTTSTVSAGEYLARASNCLSCHTSISKDSAVGAGGRRIETPYGVMITSNITPDMDTGIGSWSFDDFYKAVHSGIGKNGQYLYPVMPYTNFNKMSRDDVWAIYTYLKTLKPVYRPIESNQLRFPYSMRWGQSVWRALFFKPEPIAEVPSQSKEWNRGNYLVNGPAHCVACHTPRNFLGGIEKGKSLEGGKVGSWVAPNLRASDENYGIESWSQVDLEKFLKTGTMHGRTVLGPMAEVVYDGLQYLSDEDIRSIATYVKSLSVPGNKFSPERAGGLYSQNCSGCHQQSGKGVPGSYPSLVNNDNVTRPDAGNLINVIILGIPPQGNYGAMPDFGDKLSDGEIADIVNYLKTQWGDGAPLVTPDQVAKQRRSLDKSSNQ